MKKLLKALKGYKQICFLDFEATQFTSEMIAYGAVIAKIDKEGNIVSKKAPIMFYIKAKNKIGKYVESLTGITQETLDRAGISFAQGLTELKKYCGLNYSKTIFMTFGNNDMRIMNQSISYNLDTPKNITSAFHANFFDYQAFISEFVKDKSNNPLSLENYIARFGLEFEGAPHDPKYDAINLMNLYQAFLDKKDLVLEEYLKALSHTPHLPNPIQAAIKQLTNGESVSGDQFQDYCKEYLK